MALMKHCQPKQLPIANGLWMPMGRFDRAFRTDWPVHPHFPFTFASPTFQSLDHFIGRAQSGGVQRNDKFLLGGWHMTNFAFPPFVLIKTLICTECPATLGENLVRQLEKGSEGVQKMFSDESSLSSYSDSPNPNSAWKARTQPVSTLSGMAPYKDRGDLLLPPRVVQCNKQRYEAWFGPS